ncbi:MAG: competence/damage-inducible protein A [Bacteroidales bacterium]|nr:competence/damage-inducible protein A [Bacteroidales bacterium]
MNATIINIGDELLIGQVVNTNAARMSQMLTGAGIQVHNVFTIGDDAYDIKLYLELGLQAADIVLITGGLGPTKDDITKTTLCEFFGSELYENEIALENVTRLMKAFGRELTPINRQQALVPRCCTVINNVLGTAPCMWFEVEGTTPQKVVVSLPGVPFEMVNLMETEVIPRLQTHFHTSAILNKNILVQGIGESFLSDLIEPWETALPHHIRLAYLPQAGMLKLRLTARGTEQAVLKQEVDTAVAGLYQIARQYIVGEDFETLPELLAHLMHNAGQTLASAESCTGGAIASKLTALAGASDYFLGGVVSYSNEVKEKALGVKHSTLTAHGAVSEETVREMVTGVRNRLGSDYAVATTGIAGPGGGTPTKPVGTVWIGIATPKQVIAKRMHFTGRREQVIERTCNEVYASLIRIVKEELA